MSRDDINLRPGVYLVKTALPELAAYLGDHITVCPDDQPVGMLHRDLDRFDIATMLQAGSVERIGDVTPASASRSYGPVSRKRRRAGGRYLRLES